MAKLSFNAETGDLGLGRFGHWAQIPAELRARRQWAVATLTVGSDGKPDKKPRRADGVEMEWRNPLQWLSFEEASNSGYPAIGYILSAGDPFTIIDLDVDDSLTEEDATRHKAILNAFPTYTEYSVSGRGLHLILLGRISGGLRRGAVEIYDQERFMLCTGNVFTPGPLQSHPAMLEQLVYEMGGVSSTKELPPSEPETCGDEDLLARIERSRQGEKFRHLMDGAPCSSENDAALFAILAFWTQNHDQILRIFAKSKLYRPRGEADGKKGHTSKTYHDKYLMDTLAGALALRPADPAADIEHGRQLVAAMMAKPTPAASAVAHPPKADVEFPPGLVGEIAHYIYWSAPRPLKEVAIAGALAMMAGICGRQYNVSGGAGLNLYIILLASSGMGKEAAKTGVDRLFHAMTQTNPGTGVFLGPRIVSGPAYEKAPAEHNPCFVTFVGEIGVRLQQMLAKRGGDPQMKAAMLALATAGQRGRRYQGAFHSKKDDRTADIVFPAVSVFGESNPQEYYKAISGDSFADGFVPRFLTITSHETEIRPLNAHQGMPPPPALVEKISRLAQYAVDLQVRDQYIDVACTYMGELDELYRKRASDLSEGPMRVINTRAALMVAKIAALLAVGEHQLNPQVSRQHMDWAMELVDASIRELAVRESVGDLSTDEDKKVPAVRAVVNDLLATDPKRLKSYGMPPQLMDRRDLVSGRVLIKRLSMRAPFFGMERDKDQAITRAIQTACDLDMLQRLTDQQTKELFNKVWKAGVYCLGDAW